tara:strand:+ start:413 stop:1015 length:603 start_codon:yes stop_codon:yes gene_type:complete
MKHFALVSITVYLFYLFVYVTWSFIGFQVLNNSNLASYLYLPAGSRVLLFCFFRWRAIPALIAAEATGYGLLTISLLNANLEPSIWWWELSLLSSLSCVVAAVTLVKWALDDSLSTPGLLKPISFANYKFLILVIFLTALLNAVVTNSVIAYFNPFMFVDAERVMRYFIGDILGCFVLIGALIAIFKTLKDSSFIIPVNK